MVRRMAADNMTDVDQGKDTGGIIIDGTIPLSWVTRQKLHSHTTYCAAFNWTRNAYLTTLRAIMRMQENVFSFGFG